MRYWDGSQWTSHTAPLPAYSQPTYRPARAAHGILYWVTVGWMLSPLKWSGRVFLWLFLWPLGLWRSMHNSRSKDRARMRR